MKNNTGKNTGNLSSTLGILLEKLQNRISSISVRTTQNEEDLTTVENFGEELDKKIGVQAQALKDNATGTTYALNALKDSAQRGFDGVRSDMRTVESALTKFNARISGLEGQVKSDHEVLSNVRNRVGNIEIEASQEAAKPSSTSKLETELETELKALLTRFGYRVSAVTIGKSTYGSGNGWTAVNGALPEVTVTENIEVKVIGTKAL